MLGEEAPLGLLIEGSHSHYGLHVRRRVNDREPGMRVRLGGSTCG